MSSPLTPREAQVFQLIVEEGLSNSEIAERLDISERVVKFHVGNLIPKHGAPTRIKMIVDYWRSVCGIEEG